MNPTATPAASKIGLSDVAILLLERRRFFCLSMAFWCLAGLAAGGLFATCYNARAVITKSNPERLTDLSFLAGKNKRVAEIFKSAASGRNTTTRFLGILSSRGLAEKVIARFNLVHAYGFDRRAGYSIEDVIERYFRNVETSEDNLGNIAISVFDEDPVRAASMANYIAGECDTVSQQLSRQSAENSRVFFEQRLVEIRRDLDAAMRRLSDFQAENNVFALDQQVESSFGALDDREGEQMAVDLQIAGIRNEFRSENQRLSELEEQERVLQTKLREYMGTGGTIFPALGKLPRSVVRYGELLRDARIQETLYEYVFRFREQARLEEANNVPTLYVLENAKVPEKKTQPNRTIIWMMFLFGGFIVTSSVECAARWWNIQRGRRTLTYEKWHNVGLLLGWKGLWFSPEVRGGKAQ